MSDEIKPKRWRFVPADENGPADLEECSEGYLVDYKDYEALRRATVSKETAEEMAKLLRAIWPNEYTYNAASRGKEVKAALARFEAEGGGE